MLRQTLKELANFASVILALGTLALLCIALSGCSSPDGRSFGERYSVIRGCCDANPAEPDAGIANAFGAIGGAFASANGAARHRAITACMNAHGIE